MFASQLGQSFFPKVLNLVKGDPLALTPSNSPWHHGITVVCTGIRTDTKHFDNPIIIFQSYNNQAKSWKFSIHKTMQHQKMPLVSRNANAVTYSDLIKFE